MCMYNTPWYYDWPGQAAVFATPHSAHFRHQKSVQISASQIIYKKIQIRRIFINQIVPGFDILIVLYL